MVRHKDSVMTTEYKLMRNQGARITQLEAENAELRAFASKVSEFGYGPYDQTYTRVVMHPIIDKAAKLAAKG